jgi:hypothetical protein
MISIEELQSARNELIREIDEVFAELARKLEEEETGESPNETDGYERIYPLSYNPGSFKGEKPTRVIFGRERVDVYTWKNVFSEIMKRCNGDADKHRALMDLRGRLSGRRRAFLSDRPDGMRSPLKIDNKLYAETHYDTETLLRILLHRILDVVKYEYGNIYVAVRNDK